MLFILSQSEELEFMNLTIELPTIDREWMQNCYAIGLADFDIIIEKLFRYSEHYMYKHYFKQSYRIPDYKYLSNDTRLSISALGNLLYSFYEIATNLYGLLEGVFVYQLVRDEFKRYYIVIDKPVKRNFIIKHKQLRSKMNKYVNPFDENTNLYKLVSSALKYSEMNHTFKIKVFNVFVSNYKAWCDAITTDKDWYHKGVF